MKALVIETQKLKENIEAILKFAEGKTVIAVLKSNAYGMGLLPFARVLSACGIRFFAVSDIHDAAALRENGFDQEILLLSAAELPHEIDLVLKYDITATVASVTGARSLNEAAKQAEKKVLVHLNFETGFGRFGFNSAEEFLSVSEELTELKVVGAYTHLSNAFGDERDTRRQYERFAEAVRTLENAGISVEMKHICNSCAALRYPDLHLDAVRIGSAFLGRLPIAPPVKLHRIAYLQSEVSYVKQLSKGANIGYANTCRLKRDTKTAVIQVGYADGFAMEKRNDTFRFLDILRYMYHDFKLILSDNRTYISIEGKKYPLLGRISMYNIIADVSASDVKPGDSVRIEINPILVNPQIERRYL